MPPRPRPRPRKGPSQLRIIGGSCRGRRLGFPDLPGLRPTGDRVRETLFNWLQGDVAGASCLDLFAGSGALGLEAASRGAASVTLLEQSATAARALRDNARHLGLQHTEVIQTDALDWLNRNGPTFDLVFLDPPFAAGLHRRALDLLLASGRLHPAGLIYLERSRRQELEIPDALTVLKEKQSGEVYFCLLGTEDRETGVN